MSKTKRTYKMYKGSISTELEKRFHYIYCIMYILSQKAGLAFWTGLLERPVYFLTQTLNVCMPPNGPPNGIGQRDSILL